jgi:predicted membrane GTPase involved in stress response
VIEIKKQEFVLIKDKEVYHFKIVGFDDRNAYGEIYFTKNDRTTSIFRGSDVKEVIRLAKKESCNLRRG